MFASSEGEVVLEWVRGGGAPLPLLPPFVRGARGPFRWSFWWEVEGGASAISMSEPFEFEGPFREAPFEVDGGG